MNSLHEALFYKKLSDNQIQCTACNRFCLISENHTGYCKARLNQKGKLYSLVYSKTLTLSVDPIEKKPLFHFKPGSQVLSISTFGCNFSCLFCQNSEMSQKMDSEIQITTPEQIISFALKNKIPGLAFTYTEPTIFVEYALDIMKFAKKNNLFCVWVSNGFMSTELVKTIAPFLDAINIDLKGNSAFYKKMCSIDSIEPIKSNIKFFSKLKVHVEITNLIIPGLNDSKKDLLELISFVKSIDPSLPVHFSAFHPNYKLTEIPVTPESTILQAQKLALEAGLKNVFTGNLANEQSNSFCSNCNEILISRKGYSIKIENLDSKGNCSKCGFPSKIIL